MKFSTFLEYQFAEFIQSYSKFQKRNLTFALVCTVVFSLIGILLLAYTDFGDTKTRVSPGLLQFIFTWYSSKGSYCLIDLSKIVFLFMVSIYSVTLTYNDNESKNTSNSLFSSLRTGNVIFFLGLFALLSVLDYLMFILKSFIEVEFESTSILPWVKALFFHFRIYLALMVFALGVNFWENGKMPSMKLWHLLYVLASLWLMNEFAYEFTLLIREMVFKLLLAPLKENSRFLWESLLSIPLLAFLFPGYHAAMRAWFILEEELEALPVTES